MEAEKLGDRMQKLIEIHSRETEATFYLICVIGVYLASDVFFDWQGKRELSQNIFSNIIFLLPWLYFYL